MKIGFVHIPKSAGGSIVRWAQANHANVFVEIGHKSLAEYSKHHTIMRWRYTVNIS